MDEVYDVAGKLPFMAMLLTDVLATYVSSKKYSIMPQYRLLPDAEYKCDYAIIVGEIKEVSWYHTPLFAYVL